ncbi:hypothetical protein LEAN103870_07040 [Legionella anisa]|uniref:DUF2788 domain-containing protein n=1 Tax=Legionella anisa TaxID=28082 RepID=A0AAX0WZH0_9GAMM|nr:hypothetical protein [Legionella anisa]KTC68648.1 hypothetical protein Lani_2935 [Legionella anisa]MBN5937711.1 hypothetical protein [Legionella anisa]PNL73988.1 hypothetical protein A6J39_000610 [Legionella anisa]UAK81468.1 hypothetical protein K8O89_18925 [Legionella anisa]
MNFFSDHEPLLIAVFAFFLGLFLMIAMKNERSKNKRLIATLGFLFSFFGFIAITVILFLGYLPRIR